MRHFNWKTNFPTGNTTISFNSGFEKSAPRIFKFIEVIKIINDMYDFDFSKEELDFLVEVVKAARTDIKNKSNLKIVK